MEIGSVTKRKADQAPSVLTEDRVDDIRQRMDVSLNKSVRKLALQTGDDDLDRSFFSDEAWFHLSGYVNSQNYCTWIAMSRRQITNLFSRHNKCSAI
ncbi:hypothetical protein Trydic_g19311 [Trypoxylus dichotomus]